MNDNLDFFYKLELYNFGYTDQDGTLSDYVVGKSIVNNTERYVSSVTINPTHAKELEMFKKFVRVADSLDGKTIGIDSRLLTAEVIEILKETYQSGHVLGIRLIPEDSILSKEIFDKFNVPEFAGFLIASDKVDEKINQEGSDLEIVNQEGIFTIEHVTYQNKNLEDNDNYNVHINHKLTEEEVKRLVDVMNEGYYDQLYIDFYDPSYYKKLLIMLGKYGIDEDVVIRFIGNPLYDEVSCYEDIDEILPNEVNINYNSCHEINDFYSKEPYTEGVNYYSDIEANGITDIGNYYEMLELIDNVCNHMDEMGYTPLEKIAYLEDYFKDNFDVDEEYSEDKQLNDRDDKVYRKDDLVIKGISGLYSAILRKSGVLCYTYGTDVRGKNIVRVKDPKYDVDNLALIDTIQDRDVGEDGNTFNSFLVPIDNDIYAQTPEVISIPTSLVISTDEYENSIDNSNPVYTSNPLGYAVRMLQLMGLGYGDREFKDVREETEYYKAALANSSIIEEIPYDKIAAAVTDVREREGKYNNEKAKEEDFAITSRNLQARGNDYYVAPSIKLFGPPEGSKDVELFKVFASDEFDKHFVEMADQNENYHPPRKRNEEESLEDYDKYLEYYYGEELHKENNNVNGVVRNMKEYVTDNTRVDEVVLYRDVNDSGRVYATKEVFDRFGYETPRFVLRFGNEKLYEMRIPDVIQVLNSSTNSYKPYVISYKYINVNENIVFKEDNEQSNFDKYNFFRRMSNPGKLYIKKEVADRLNQNFGDKVVMVGDVECYEVGEDAVLYVDDKKKEETPKEDFKPKKKLVIYRDVNRPSMLYLRKDSYEKFDLKTDVEEVIISGIPCCVIDQGDLSYIVNHANNSFNPYEIEYKDIEINVKNMKPIYTETPTEVIRIFRNVDDKDKFYIKKDVFDKFHFNTDVEEVVISGLPLYVIDDNDLAYIISNASNKFNPYQIAIIDVKLDSKNMRPATNEKAVDEVILYKAVGENNQFYMEASEFKRFGFDTPVEEVTIGGKLYYLIDNNDLEYIVRKANNKIYPYKIAYKDLSVEKEETASDMLDEDLIPGTNFKKPRARGINESDEEYVSYLEEYYKEIFGIGNQIKK